MYVNCVMISFVWYVAFWYVMVCCGPSWYVMVRFVRFTLEFNVLSCETIELKSR